MLSRNCMSRRCPCTLSCHQDGCRPSSTTGRAALSLSHHCAPSPPPPRPLRQLLPPSLEPIKRIKNLCTKNHLLKKNTLAILLLSKNHPTTTRKPDEVQPCSSLTYPAWKRGASPWLSLGYQAVLLATSSPCNLQWGRASKQRWRPRGDRGGARPECWHQD